MFGVAMWSYALVETHQNARSEQNVYFPFEKRGGEGERERHLDPLALARPQLGMWQKRREAP